VILQISIRFSFLDKILCYKLRTIKTNTFNSILNLAINKNYITVMRSLLKGKK